MSQLTGIASILAQSINISSPKATPGEEREACVKRVTTERWKSACRDIQEVRGAATHSCIEAEEMCTKRFHIRFKQKGSKTTIQELYPMTGTQITPGAPAFDTQEEILEQVSSYFGKLMAANQTIVESNS